MSTFSRDPGTLALMGIEAAGLCSLIAGLADARFERRIIAADLSLGAWRSHQVASEFGVQLGLGAGTPGHTIEDRGCPLQSRVGWRIDADIQGDRVTLEALRLANDLAATVLDRAPITFCVLAPRYSLQWECGDILFLRFFAQALKSTPHRLVLAAPVGEPPEVPADWCVTWSRAPLAGSADREMGAEGMAALVPGTITPPVASALQLSDSPSLLKLPGGCFLVAPESRREFRCVARERYDELGAKTGQIRWLGAYAGCHGTVETANPWLLWQQARDEFDAGGFGIASRILSRAITLARTATERCIFQLLNQSARIASAQFREAAECPEPNNAIPAELHGWLCFTKGWALTMLGQSSDAEPLLQRARELLRNADGSEEYLYLLNICALNRLKLEDRRGALAIEQQIRSILDRADGGISQLKYINSINLARLHRIMKEHDLAEYYYREAFGTCVGVRSDADLIYMNVCEARLHEDRGGPAEAYTAWLRATLYWISSPAPEALGRRVVAAILGPEKWAPGNAIDSVAAALISHLAAAASAAQMGAEISAIANPDPARAPTFARSERITEFDQRGPWQALLVAKRWLLGSEAELPPTIASGTNRRLRSVLLGLVSIGGNRTACRNVHTLIVDDQLGRDLPSSDSELLAVCLRLNLPALVVNGQVLYLDEVARQRLESFLRVRICTAVRQVQSDQEGVLVQFRRYRGPQRVTDAAGEVLTKLAAADLTIAECRALSGLSESVISLVRSLERDRIVEIHLPADVTLDSWRCL